MRISFASLVACGLIVLGFKLAFPGIAIPNLLPMLFVLPMLVAMLTLQTYALSKTKARIMITPKKIFVSHGQSATTIKPDSLTEVILAVHDDQKARIRFCYQRHGVRRQKIVGVSDDLDLVELEQLLPVEITPKDYRRTKRKMRFS